MFKKFVNLEIKSFFRSPRFASGIAMKIASVFLLLYFSAVFIIAAFGLFVSRLTGRVKVGVLYSIIVIGLIQLRAPFDGIISFAGLLPLTAGLSVAAVVILISRRGIGWTTLAALAYS